MSLKPVPVIASVPDITDPLPQDILLDGTGSLPSPGPPAATSVVGWLWTLQSKPPGSAAYLTDDTSATPTLRNIDLEGSYLISLKVTDDLGRVSHAGINPIQSNEPPYGFSLPVPSSMVAVRALTATGLVKLAYGERNWLERGLWELVDRIDENTQAIEAASSTLFPYYDIPTRTLTANVITPDNGVSPANNSVSIGGLVVRNDVSQTEHELYSSYDKINLLSETFVTNKDLTVAGGVLRTNSIKNASGDLLKLEIDDGDILITTDGEDRTIFLGGSGVNNSIAMQVTDDITLTATDDITLNASGVTGNIILQALGTSGALSARASGAVLIESTTASGGITLTTSGANVPITLNPITHTFSTKPVFAPGLDYSDTYATAGSGKPLTPNVVFTRHVVGCEMVVDSLVQFTLPKPDVAVLKLYMKLTTESEEELMTLTAPMSEGTGLLYFRTKCSSRFISDTVIAVHVEAQTLGDLVGATTTTQHVFKTYTYSPSKIRDPLSFYSSWTGANLTSSDYSTTARLTLPHDREVL